MEYEVRIGKKKKVGIKLTAKLVQQKDEDMPNVGELEDNIKSLEMIISEQRKQMLSIREDMAELNSIILAQNQQNEELKKKIDAI